MPHVELKTIDKKIEQTRSEIRNVNQCTDENLRVMMTSELETRLEALLQKKEKMEAAISKETISLRIYGDTVKTGKVSSRILLSALGGFQSMLDSVANAMLNSPTDRGKIPGYIKDITGFEVVGTFSGSFGLVLERQISQLGFDSANTTLNGVLNEVFCVLETMDDSEKLFDTIAPLGKRTVINYRQWIDELRESGVNLELGWKDDSASLRKIHLVKDIAPSIIATLDTIGEICDEEVTLNGMLNGINIRSHSFELSVQGYGLVKGTASPETLMSIVEKIGTEITVNMIKSLSHTKAGIEKTSWYMIGMIQT